MRQTLVLLGGLFALVLGMLTPIGASATTPAAPPAPATIYGDALGAGWQATPWSGTANVAATAPVHAGARSIAFTATAGWGGLSLHHGGAGVGTAPYAHLAFALRATQPGQRVGVALHGADYQKLRDYLPLAGYGGDPVAGGWKEYRIPLADLRAAGLAANGVSFQDMTGTAQPPLYIDQVQLAAAAPASAATPPATTPTPTATPPAAIPTPTPPATSAAPPVRLSMFTHPPTDGTTTEALARYVGAAVYTRGDEAHRDRLRAAGYRGPITQYILANETSGPPGLVNAASACGAYLYYQNNPSGIAGDFCSALHGDERNFLHNGRGERLYGTQSWQEGATTKRVYLYLMNPAAPGWRAYAARRAGEEARALGYDGIFLDNVDLSLDRGQRQETNRDGIVREYATNEAYRAATAGFLAAVKAELGPTPLWANLASGTDAPGDWDAYLPHLDGVMNEYFAARWYGTYASPTVWETQLRQAERLLGQGKEYLIVSQGGRADTARMRFALASYLLVARDGATFRYADNTGGESTSPSYDHLWRYPEYDARLGAPTSDRYQAGTTWRRDFACGSVTADPTAHTGTIVVDASRPGCA